MITAQQARELDKSAWVKTLTISEESAVWTAIDYIAEGLASSTIEESIMYEAFFGKSGCWFFDRDEAMEANLETLGYQVTYYTVGLAKKVFAISWEE